jgi:5-methylthioribose kinase
MIAELIEKSRLFGFFEVPLCDIDEIIVFNYGYFEEISSQIRNLTGDENPILTSIYSIRDALKASL